MKKIFKIFIFCLVLTMSACALTACSKVYGERYYNAELYTASSSFTFTADIQNVYIEWEVGAVNVVSKDGDTFRVSETYSGVETNKQMHYLIQGSTLYIQFWKSGYRGEIAKSSKTLNIEIPKTLNLLEIETEDATVYSNELICSNVDISAEKGEINIRNLSCARGEIDSDKESVNVGIGTVSFLELGSDRGTVSVSLNGKGASIYFETDRGKLKTSLSNVKNERTYTFGNGEVSINVETGRGNLTVK